jgi:hypothetical protein
MTTYLKNLAEMLVNPDSGVQPRLPGRFEPPHPTGMGLFAFEPVEDREAASTSETTGAEPSASAKPTPPAGEPAEPARSAPPPGDRARVEPESAQDSSAPEILVEPPARQWQLQRSEIPRPEVRPVAPTVSREVTPTIQPTLEAPAPETAAPSAPPAQVEAVAPVAQPDLSEVPPDSSQPSPTEEHQPSPVRSEARQPARTQPPGTASVIPVEVRLAPATEPAAPTPPAPSASAPLAQRSTPRPAVPGEAPPQIEPAAPLAKTEPVPSLAAPEILGEPVPLREDERPPVEPLLVEPRVHQTKADQGPTVRVTIGRIEVRAALPTTPPQRAQPVRRRPALPLDQYLKRRSEGKG